jgi:lipoprotein-anchoring transpeptidase ErfK/SrfK
MKRRLITRRDFLKLAALGMGGLAARPWGRRLFALQDFPQAPRLGRVGWYRVDLKARPDHDSETVGVLYEDAVFPWIRERIGYRPFRNNQRYVETPDGYLWSGEVMPVRNEPNQPLTTLPQTGQEAGMWVEVTVPWVDALLDNPPARSHFVKARQEAGLPPRFYDTQILWVDQIRTDSSGQVWYRINERYGNPGDIFWAAGEAFRPLTAEELAPISPEATDKRIVVNVNLNDQSLSCYEGNREVYYCRVSTGKEKGSTPVTPPGGNGFPIWRKLHSVHMAGGTNDAGWDLQGIGWTALFVGEGVALHSTYWHNNFGETMSHGCVNLRPADAKWIFRWTQPAAPFDTGDVTIVGDGSTRITVVEG